MKLLEIMNPVYSAWQKACRAAFPNCTFTGNADQCQAVDWTSPANEVAGDWEGTSGVVYEPGSLGKRVLDTIQ